MPDNSQAPSDRYRILSDQEVQEMVAQLSSFQRPGGDEPDQDLADKVRFMPVSSYLRDGREAHGLSLHHVAASLNCSQEALHDLEAGRLGKVDGALLQAYVDHLGISEWFDRWKAANSDLAVRLGLAPGA